MYFITKYQCTKFLRPTTLNSTRSTLNQCHSLGLFVLDLHVTPRPEIGQRSIKIPELHSPEFRFLFVVCLSCSSFDGMWARYKDELCEYLCNSSKQFHDSSIFGCTIHATLVDVSFEYPVFRISHECCFSPINTHPFFCSI